MIYKYITVYFVVLLVCILGGNTVLAATTVRTGETVSVTEQQVVNGDFYALANAVSMSGEIKGDFEAVGGSITLNGVVDNDLLAVGGTVGVHATVHGDVRVVAGDVTIADNVEGNVAVFGGRLIILSTANIGGDVLFYGGDANISGSVSGHVLGNANQLRIDGPVKGDVSVTTHQLTLGDQADVTGNIQYVSQTELIRAQNATVSGTVVRNDVPYVSSHQLPVRIFSITFLILLFAILSLYLLLRRPLEKFALVSTHNFGIRVLIGFATIVLAPIIISILLVSVLGVFVGVIILFLFLLALVITIPLMNIVTVALLTKVLHRSFTLNLLWIIVGTLLVVTLLFIPWIGPLVFFTLLLGTLGSIVMVFYQNIR